MSAPSKTSFRKTNVIAPVYTGGPVAISNDGSRIATTTEELILTEVATGQTICTFEGDSTPVTALAICPSSKHLLSFTGNLALIIYALPISTERLSTPSKAIRKVTRAHEAPVHVLVVDPSSNLAASGASDGVVKVWDITRGYVTHSFRGHGGVISSILFHRPPSPLPVAESLSQLHLITASVDMRIRMFELSSLNSRSSNAKPFAVLEGHTSVVRALSVSSDSSWLASGSRDGMAMMWGYPSVNKSEQQITPNKTIPIFERVEALGFLQSSTYKDSPFFYTGGQKGVVRIWDSKNGTAVTTFPRYSGSAPAEETETEELNGVIDIIYLASSDQLLAVYADQNILFYDIGSTTVARQIIGFNDEIVDCTFVSPASHSSDSHLALATNSAHIRIYNVSTLSGRLIEGHSEIVLCLTASVSGRLLASGSKDNTVRIWSFSSPESDAPTTVGICEGHTESVGSVAFQKPRIIEDSIDYLFTGSQDRTIKMWNLSPLAAKTRSSPSALQCLSTIRAHEKDINSLDVSPRDHLLASGSQDKTANIYRIEHTAGRSGVRSNLTLLGVCKGHKRGVWDVKFSPTESLLATASADKTIRIWNVHDFSCIKTLEGHANSVLRLKYMNNGAHLISAGSDGLVKLWSLKDENCIASLDNHNDKVWGLCTNRDDSQIVSASADSVVTIWTDHTDVEALDNEVARAATILQEQSFDQYCRSHDYRMALSVAISMAQPGRILKLFREIQSSTETHLPDPTTTHTLFGEFVQSLTQQEVGVLLSYVRTWNSSARTSEIAQNVLNAVLKCHRLENDTLAADPSAADRSNPGIFEVVETLIPYTERHLLRLDKLIQESYIIDTLIEEMDNGLTADQDEL